MDGDGRVLIAVYVSRCSDLLYVHVQQVSRVHISLQCVHTLLVVLCTHYYVLCTSILSLSALNCTLSYCDQQTHSFIPKKRKETDLSLALPYR